MKTPVLVKADKLRPQFEALLRELLGRVPSLKVVDVGREVWVAPSTYPDWLVRVTVNGQEWTLFAEEAQGEPRRVRWAISALQRYLSLSRSVKGYGVVLAPFISEESARICTEAGVGYADLAGNARLSFDSIYIETRVPGNSARERRVVRSLFAPAATRVLRVLLQGPLRPWKVVELAEAAQVSLGLVSSVRQQLLLREWAVEEKRLDSTKKQAAGIRASKPDAIVEAWAKADAWEKRTNVREYSVLVTDPLELAGRLKSVLPDQSPVFTQWFAGWLRHPYVTPTIVTAYVKAFPDETLIREKLLGRGVSTGGRLRLAQPKDKGVFNPSQTVRGFELVSDVQIYLDLLQAGLRGEEQAAELKKWPDFSGGWA